MAIFKNTLSEKRWTELHKERAELQAKKKTVTNEEKIELISSLMTSCKIGFNLNEAKVKKIIKFLKQETGIEKVKYGLIPDDFKPKSTLFKEIVVLYAEKDGQIIFKESDKK